MPVLKIYEDDSRDELVAVFSGFPWEWDYKKKTLTVWKTKTDGIQYRCESMDYNEIVYRAYKSIRPTEKKEEGMFW